MVTITDTYSILNLSLLEVFFLCDEESISHQKEIIDRLNEEKVMHNGLFHYNVILRGSTPYEQLPGSLIKEIKRHNVFIHLVNGIHHYFNYGLGEIDMMESYESIQKNVDDFIHEVCEFNINNLEMLKERCTDSAFADMRDYEDKGVVEEIFKGILDDNLSNLSDEKVKEIQQTINTHTNTLSKSKSLELFQNAFGEVNPGVMGREFFLTTPPQRKPQIKVKIEQIASGKSRKLKYGVVMDIDGDHVEITFKNSNETTIYFVTLLCKKVGIEFHPRYFEGSEKMYMTNLMRETYERISNSPYSDWIERMKECPSDRNSAKSSIQKIILDTLKEKHPNAIYYCELNIERSLSGRYQVNLDENEIELDKAFEDTFWKLQRDLYVYRKINHLHPNSRL